MPTEDLAILRELKGNSFPFRISSVNGGVITSEGIDHIFESIEKIITTNKKERVMRPDFGAGLDDIIFDSNIDITNKLITSKIGKEIYKWEKHVRLKTANVKKFDKGKTISCEITIEIKKTKQVFTREFVIRKVS